MAKKLKYEKNFVTKDKPGYKYPAYMHPNAKTTRRLAYIDETTVKDAEFGCENMWLLPGGPKEQKIMERQHPAVRPLLRVLLLQLRKYPRPLCRNGGLYRRGKARHQ